MMIALYEFKRHAFSGNINLLHEGAVRHIPAEQASGQLAPATATAEVAGHTQLWQTDPQQPAPSDFPAPNIMASADAPAD